MTYRDPGWRASILRTALYLVPFVRFLMLRRTGARDPLVELRSLFLSFVITPWLFLVVLLFIVDDVGSPAGTDPLDIGLLAIPGELWVYLPALAFSMFGMAGIAPTRGDIERRQRELTARGVDVSLGEALLELPSRGRDEDATA